MTCVIRRSGRPLYDRAPFVIVGPVSHCLLLHAGASMASPSRADHGNGQDMLTIPGIASSFGASHHKAAAVNRERRSSGEQGRIRWRLPPN